MLESEHSKWESLVAANIASQRRRMAVRSLHLQTSDQSALGRIFSEVAWKGLLFYARAREEALIIELEALATTDAEMPPALREALTKTVKSTQEGTSDAPHVLNQTSKLSDSTA